MNQTQLKYALNRVHEIEQALINKVSAQVDLDVLEDSVKFSNVRQMLLAIQSGEIDLVFPERDIDNGSFYNIDDFVLPKGYLEKHRAHKQSKKDADANETRLRERVRLECERVRDSIALGTADESVKALQDLSSFDVFS